MITVEHFKRFEYGRTIYRTVFKYEVDGVIKQTNIEAEIPLDINFLNERN
jgi:hypothetical protein